MGNRTDQRQAFIRRVRLAREARFPDQAPIALLLGVDRDTYKHYETRTPLPHHLIPKFVAATGIDYEWLLTGVGHGPMAPPKPRRRKP